MTRHRMLPRTVRALLCAILIVGWLPASAQPVRATPCEVPLPVSADEASRLLAEERPFAPTNRDLFYSYENPDWADAAPLANVEGPALDEEGTRVALFTFLERRFPCDPNRIHEALATFGDPMARAKFPEPTLRAALAALTGTIGEPAIEFLLYRTPVALVNFGISVDSDTGVAGRVGAADHWNDGRRYIVIDRLYRFAPFGAFSALLVHEALHTGDNEDSAGLPEEAVASAVEALVYMEMLLTDPTLAQLPDELTRMSSNHMALVRLNSGPAGSDRLTVHVPGNDINIDPLTTEPLTEFYEYYARYSAPADPEFRDRETTGNWLLQEILARLAEPGQEPPASANFDQATVAFVDRNQAALTPAELIAVACILKLDVPCA